MGVIGIAVSATLLWVIGVDSLWLRIPAWFAFVTSVFWYVVPGHALIYGPHLFLLAIWDLLTYPLRKDQA